MDFGISTRVIVNLASLEVTHIVIEDIDARHDAVFGKITGGLAVLLGVPIGLVVGVAARAVTGRVAAGKIDMGFLTDEYLEKFQADIPPVTSAIIMPGEEEWINHSANILNELERNLPKQTITSDKINYVLKA